MFARALAYELRRSTVPFIMLSLLTMGMVFLMRMQVFPSSDILLFYLIFFGAAGVSAYRFYHTMFGREAVFMYSLPLSASAQIMMRVCTMLVQSAFSVLLSAAALMLQGEALGRMLLNVSFDKSMALLLITVFSLWQFMLTICIILTLAHLPLCRNRRGVWLVIWSVIVFGVMHGFSSFTAGMMSEYLIVYNDGSMALAANIAAQSISISLNQLIWNVIFSIPVIGLMCGLTHRYQLL